MDKTPDQPPATPHPTPVSAHLLPFLTREAGHPWVTLQKENLVSSAVVAKIRGAGSAGVYRPRRPWHPAPVSWTGALELTTPPRGPVFPGEPWKKRSGT